MPLLHESSADIAEKPFIGKVLDDLHYRRTLFNIKNLTLSDAVVLREVELRLFRKTVAGDVDILVVRRWQPELAQRSR